MPFHGDVQHTKYLLQSVPLDGLLSIFYVPNDGSAYASQLGKPALGEPGLLAVVLNDLGKRVHIYCYSSYNTQNSRIARRS